MAGAYAFYRYSALLVIAFSATPKVEPVNHEGVGLDEYVVLQALLDLEEVSMDWLRPVENSLKLADALLHM